MTSTFTFYFLQLISDYREHCGAIENKIVGVMSDTLERQLSTWEARSPVPSPSFNGILKAVTKLHETVSGILPPPQVKSSMICLHFISHSRKGILVIYSIRHLNILNISPCVSEDIV